MSQQNKTFGESLADQRRGSKGTEVAEWKIEALHPGRAKATKSFTNMDPDAKASLDRYRGSKPLGYSDFTHQLGGPDPDSPAGMYYHAKGGMVKKGSYNVPQMCKGGKVIKSWSK